MKAAFQKTCQEYLGMRQMACDVSKNMIRCQSGELTHGIGALTGDRILTVAMFDYSIHADVFEAWLQQVLLPVLPNRAVVVMDNERPVPYI